MDDIPWKAFNYGIYCNQIKLSINSALIHSNIWRSICTAWRVFMPSSHNYHGIALFLGTILWTIDCECHQCPGGNPPLAALEISQIEVWLFLYPITSVACAFSTAGGIGSCVRWLQSWNDLRTTQFAPRYTRSEQWKLYVMQMQHLASWTFLTMTTKSRLEASHSWGAWSLGQMKAGPFCVH